MNTDADLGERFIPPSWKGGVLKGTTGSNPVVSAIDDKALNKAFNIAIIYLENYLNRFMGYGETFKALSDPARREILFLLRKGRMSAGDISKKFDMTQATVSYHLKTLKEADLIFEEKEKNYIYYSLNTSVIEEVMLWLSDLKKEGDNNVKGKKK